MHRRAMKRFLALLLCFALVPAYAFATQGSSTNPSYPIGQNELPEKYFLTNLGEVTPAKFQSPWETCWAFAIASAIESSILKAEKQYEGTGSGVDGQQAGSGTDASDSTPQAPQASNAESPSTLPNGAELIYDQATNSVHAIYPGMEKLQLGALSSDVDVSERAIGWFAHELQSESSGKSQAGEGYCRTDEQDALSQFMGNSFDAVEAALSARQNLTTEQNAPYAYNGYDGTGIRWFDSESNNSADDARLLDWSLDDSLRTSRDTGWHVKDILNLQSPAILETDYETGEQSYMGYNPVATTQIKQALMDVGGVAVAIESDTYIPAQVAQGETAITTQGDTMNYNSWSQYDDNPVITRNHAVTIVGWDDSYSVSEFGGNNGTHPPAEGAWLCKNNWGNDNYMQEIGYDDNTLHWGIPYEDESGNSIASGFFWVSYYDHSLNDPLAFEVAPDSAEEGSVYQYDYLGKSEFIIPDSYENNVCVANVFTAEATELLRQVSAWTFEQNDNVKTWVYALPKVDRNSAAYTGDEFKGLLSKGELLCEQNNSFEIPGFHTIDLKEPILVHRNEQFAVIQNVSNVSANSDGEIVNSSYLSLELSFLEDLDINGNTMRSSVVSNPGESYVAVFDENSWMSVDEYNAWYADFKAQGNLPVDAVFGNALVKAMTSKTTMGSGGHIYELVQLK